MKFIRPLQKGMKSWPLATVLWQKTRRMEKRYAIEDVRAVLAAKTQAGKRREVKELLLKYDSGKLSGVNPENYAALLADAEAL